MFQKTTAIIFLLPEIFLLVAAGRRKPDLTAKVERRIAEGDENAKRIYEAQAYQIAKGIGEMAPPLCGKIDAVILTGGMAYSKYITEEVTRRVEYLGRVIVVAGENEMEALSLGALRILNGEEGYSEYVNK